MVSHILEHARLSRLNKWIFRHRADTYDVVNGQDAARSEPVQEAFESDSYERPPAQDHKKLGNIAEASVQLAALGPRLATLAAEMEAQAQAQARRAGAIAQTMEALTRDLEKAVGELRTCSGQVGEALTTVSRIADHTRIISLNASIEAARAGVHGQAFGVIVEEVQRLADRTGSTTHLIEERMGDMKSSIVRVARVTGDSNEHHSSQGERSVEAVNQEVHGMAQLADKQLGGSQSLHKMSDHVQSLAEALLLSVGSFRFEAHERAEHEVELFIPNVLKTGNDQFACERLIEGWLQNHPYFELAYLTDVRGRQFIDNICNRDGVISHDRAGLGRDWSKRPWYLAALHHADVHSTDIYRSTATGDFCFTVAAALRNKAGEIVGVLGADVNFQTLLKN